METRRLEAFVKVVDLGSVTSAAKVLNVAQPALSQQIASLEAEFKRQLLVRSTRGVMPTEAGRTLYRYAKSIQRQIDEARRSVLDSEQELSGNVTIGLAPLSSATLFGPPLLTQLRRRHPGIILHIFDSFGVTLSELMLKGSMDIAILYGDRSVRGLDYKPLVMEEFYLVAPRDIFSSELWAQDIRPEELAKIDLMLPSRESFLRQAIERVCAEVGERLRIVAEIQSRSTLSSAMMAGVGATVLPKTVAQALPNFEQLGLRRIDSHAASLQMSLCISDYARLSDAAFAVYNILLETIALFKDDMMSHSMDPEAFLAE
ncbi:LysR substrate-binding domain-containing protein [Chelatococcus asaccharovorans]|uniref:LysR substrate-binding domain-containing protein n=1 Tax=Chelatococcus asaccharovorans TaxID=28210 RepID=UPI00224C7209|nr:LysR substrate-binding domain-containing protein [Chelatococcus asaccharovorans]CAH1672920.1 Nitrogen assimilation regulatory protein nac [Chelatococcus asaccharovorans]CAH1675691.1 Nitrogen assimilation regulatory protein nac [Chelatococcus asaccharovorans]